MKTLRFQFATRVLAAVLRAGVAGCNFNYTRSQCASQLATPTGPIAVEAKADCPASISTSIQDNVPTVTYNFGDKRQIVIEAKRILIDGELAHNVPPGTKKIMISVKSGQVTVQADGQSLPDTSVSTAEKEVQ